MIRDNALRAIMILLLLVPIAFLGCSLDSGGSDEEPVSTESPSPSIQVLPPDYDFGIVTAGNSAAPLEVTITNEGSAKLTVSGIALSDTNNFTLDLDSGSYPCNASSPEIAPGKSCTVEVAFEPASLGIFNATLTIGSNDPDTPVFDVQLTAIHEDVSELNVVINQVATDQACPGPEVTAYVSVIDQGGYPVTGLSEANFSVTEDGTEMDPVSVSVVSDVNAPISVALAMDYSESITAVQDTMDDMEETAAYFVDQLGIGDEAEIVKFDSEVEVVQAFTSDKDALKAAIYAPWDYGDATDLFDAAWQAVNDTAARLNDRKAVIVLTDGKNSDSVSSNNLDDVINHANDNGIPIFAIGLGDDIDIAVLQQMADDTSGQFYEATTSDNLRTIYQQFAQLLFEDQYVITYISALGTGVTADLIIEATLQTMIADDTKQITPCP